MEGSRGIGGHDAASCPPIPHGYAHVDRYDITGNRTKEALNLHFASALTYGDWDVNENWQQYRDAFLKGSKYERLQ